MKLKNKKTGEIAEASILNSELVVHYDDGRVERYSLIPEHYEEPKEWWYIDIHGPHKVTNNDEYYQQVKATSKQIGNYFETREEAEKAVRKLKAWERLKDKGFRFTLTPGVGSLDITPGKFQIEINADMPAKWFTCDAVQEDLDICFGGEK